MPDADNPPVVENKKPEAAINPLKTSQQLGSNEVYQVTKLTELRAEPNDSANVVFTIEPGTPVDVMQNYDNNWIEIKRNNLQGFIKNDFVNLAALNPEADSVYDPYPVFPDIFNHYERMQKIEEAQLPKHPDLVQRKGRMLEIQLKTNKPLVLEDQAEQYVFYSFIDFCNDAGYLTFVINYWEGSEVLVLNQTNGEQVRVNGFPLFSPDYKRFVVAFPEGDPYTSRMFRIYHIEQEKPVLEYEGINQEWSATNVSWVSDTKINFTKNFYYTSSTGSAYKEGYVYWKGNMELVGGQWVEVTLGE